MYSTKMWLSSIVQTVVRGLGGVVLLVPVNKSLKEDIVQLVIRAPSLARQSLQGGIENLYGQRRSGDFTKDPTDTLIHIISG